jgi:hypothetical protein
VPSRLMSIECADVLALASAYRSAGCVQWGWKASVGEQHAMCGGACLIRGCVFVHASRGERMCRQAAGVEPLSCQGSAPVSSLYENCRPSSGWR